MGSYHSDDGVVTFGTTKEPEAAPQYEHVGWRKPANRTRYEHNGDVIDLGGWDITDFLGAPELEPQYKWEKVFALKQDK